MTQFDIVKDFDFVKFTYNNYGDKASYSCKQKLSISTQLIDIFFDTDSIDNFPTIQQKDFFKTIIADFDNIIEKCKKIVTETYRLNSLIDNSGTQSDLQAVALTIPSVDKEQTLWDMTFKSTFNKNTFVIVYFDKYEPLSATIEKDERKSWIKFMLRLLNGNS